MGWISIWICLFMWYRWVRGEKGGVGDVKEKIYIRFFLVLIFDILVIFYFFVVIYWGLLVFNGVNSVMWLYFWLGMMLRYFWIGFLMGMMFWFYKWEKEIKKEFCIRLVCLFRKEVGSYEKEGICMIDLFIIVFFFVFF